MFAFLIAWIALVALAPAAEGQVRVDVDIGFHLPAPPRLVVIPPVPTVQYVPAPASPGNLFFYNGQYWAFSAGGWYASGGFNGPWIVVAPQFVPRPLLLVPVQYYHAPPGHWQKWERSRPPQWQEEWGPQWADKRGWKSSEHYRDGDDRPGRGKGKGTKAGKDGGKGQGAGKGKGERKGRD